MDHFQLLQPASERSCCVRRMERSSNLQEGLADHPSDSKWQNMPGPSTLSQHYELRQRHTSITSSHCWEGYTGRFFSPLSGSLVLRARSTTSCREHSAPRESPSIRGSKTSSAWAAAATGVSSTAAAATGVTAAPSCVHLFPGSGPVTSVVVTPLASLAGLGRRELLIDPV